MILKDLDFDEIVDFIEDHLWLLFSFLAPFIPYLFVGISSGSWSWVPLVIIGGGILSLILICFITLGIKYLITDVFNYPVRLIKFKNDRRNKRSATTIKNIDANSSDESLKKEEILMSLNELNLMNLAKKNMLSDYSKLNINDLNSLLMNCKSNNDNDVPKGNEKKISNLSKLAKNKKRISFDDIAGLESAKKAFDEKVIMPIKHKELYEKFGKKVGGGILLYGLPGTGKTMFAEAASNELDALFIPVKCSDIKSKWYGESEQNVKEIFEKARKANSAIIFFDEFEAIGAKRTDNNYYGNNDLVSDILVEMQGIETSKSNSMILVIAATNKPWLIDSAFLRPGRFDEKIYIPLPDFEARKKIFELQLLKLPHNDDLDFNMLANLTEGCSGADIKEICEKLKMSAINKTIASGKEQNIGMDDVVKIRDSIKSSIQIEEIEKLEEFQKS